MIVSQHRPSHTCDIVNMAKGTLHATATATKKGSISSRGAASKNGKKSSMVGESASTSTAAAPKGSKKAKTAATTAKSSTASKKVAAASKPAVSEESADDEDDDVVFVNREASQDGGAPRHLDLKSKKYDKHYKAAMRDALEGMDLCRLLLMSPVYSSLAH